MKESFSRAAIDLHRPVITAISVWLEYHLINHKDYENDDRFQVFHLEKDWSYQSLAQGMAIIKTWIDPTLFTVSSVDVRKRSMNVKWSDLLKIIERNLKTKKENIKIQAPTKIEIVVSKSGKIFRILGDKELKCNFEKGSKRLKLFTILKENEDSSDIDLLMKESENKTKAALRKMIGEINSKVSASLQLPKDENPIIGESGYELNPFYHFVFAS